MRNSNWFAAAVLVLSAGSLLAHYGYAEYDSTSPVSVEGNVGRVNRANPHVTIELETKDRGEFTVEFNGPLFMRHFGVTQATFVKAGDHVVVKGSVNRNPEQKVLTLVQR